MDPHEKDKMISDVDTSEERLRGTKRAAWLSLPHRGQASSPRERASQAVRRSTRWQRGSFGYTPDIPPALRPNRAKAEGTVSQVCCVTFNNSFLPLQSQLLLMWLLSCFRIFGWGPSQLVKMFRKKARKLNPEGKVRPIPNKLCWRGD